MMDQSLDKIRQHILSSKKITRSFFLSDELFCKSRRQKKVSKIEDLVPGALAKKARESMTEDQIGVVIDSVAYGLIKEDGFPEKLTKIIYGWKGSPKTIDARIKRILSMCVSGKQRKEERSGGSEDKRELNRYIFDDRIKKLEEEYKLDVADTHILRTMVWAEMELERMTASTGPASKEKILIVSKTVELVKNCMETLKLSRRQRNITNDDETDKELEKRYKENEGKSSTASSDVTKRADEAKLQILKFKDESLQDDIEDEDVCDICLEPECNGNCKEG